MRKILSNVSFSEIIQYLKNKGYSKVEEYCYIIPGSKSKDFILSYKDQRDSDYFRVQETYAGFELILF